MGVGFYRARYLLLRRPIVMIFPPLFPADDYECDADCIVSEMLPGAGMSAVDSLARAIGHADDWESDEMGAACSIYPLSNGDRVAFLLAAMADDYHARCSWAGAPPADAPTYSVGPSWELAPVGAWAYVRSDDRGFWDIIVCDDEAAARSLLAYWVRLNVPTYCDSCERELDREPFYGPDGVVDAYPASGLCDECEMGQRSADDLATCRDTGSCKPCPTCGSLDCGSCDGPGSGSTHRIGCPLDWIG